MEKLQAMGAILAEFELQRHVKVLFGTADSSLPIKWRKQQVNENIDCGYTEILIQLRVQFVNFSIIIIQTIIIIIFRASKK